MCVFGNIDRFAEEKMNGKVDELRDEIDEKKRLIEDMHQNIENLEQNIENLANQKAASKIEENEIIHKEEQEQALRRAFSLKEWEHAEERAGYRKQIE